MRAKAIAKLGFGYEAVAAINPAIVYTNCYGYGRRGPDRDQPAYDDTIQAECGLPAIQALLTGEANFVGTIMADKIAGLTTLYATTMALFHRQRTGEGQEVEVAMFETMASFMLVEHANGALFDPPLSAANYPPTPSPPTAAPTKRKTAASPPSSITTSIGPPSSTPSNPPGPAPISPPSPNAPNASTPSTACWPKPSSNAPHRTGWTCCATSTFPPPR